jgi:hypothetical protein
MEIMKKIFGGIVLIGLLLITGTSLANLSDLKINNNGVEHTIKNEGQISTKVSLVNKKEAKNKMLHLDFNLPSYIPNGYLLLDEVAYHEPPEEFPNGVKVDVLAHKEVQYRIQQKENPQNFYDLYIKRADTKIMDPTKKTITIGDNSIKGEININNENNTILLVWKKNGISYMILGHGEVTQDEILKIASSIK